MTAAQPPKTGFGTTANSIYFGTMKKIGGKIYLTEEEASKGFLCPEGAITIAIPICNVCQNWNGPGKCKKLGESPDIYGWGEKRDCPAAILDTENFGFPQFAELYPEDTKKLLERQEQARREPE